jgi:hypothetical protein
MRAIPKRYKGKEKRLTAYAIRRRRGLDSFRQVAANTVTSPTKSTRSSKYVAKTKGIWSKIVVGSAAMEVQISTDQASKLIPAVNVNDTTVIIGFRFTFNDLFII